MNHSCRFVMLLSLASIFTISIGRGQITTARGFGLSYSRNMQGSVTTFGNTIMHAVSNNIPDLIRMNESGNPLNTSGGLGYSQFGNDGSDMKQIDNDADSLTKNSSSADLILPSGNNQIKFARLYWGARVTSASVSASRDTLRRVKLRKGNTGKYESIIAQDIITTTAADNLSLTYQSFADITEFIGTNGQGTYTVADIPVTETDVQGGQFGGWAISVVYENQTLPFNSIRIFDGYAFIYNGGQAGSLNIKLTGLNVPELKLTRKEATMGMICWEGDANLTGDFLTVNNIDVSNAVNPVNNFFNGSISSDGNFIHTKGPDYFNQMGIDIDEVYVGTGYNIEPNATSVDVKFATLTDQYFPSVFTFSIRVKEPTITINKKVEDANKNGLAEEGEELTYTLWGTNKGLEPSLKTYIIDTLPANVTYIPGSLTINEAKGMKTGGKTDTEGDDEAYFKSVGGYGVVQFNLGQNATASNGGTLINGSDGNYSVSFKVKAGASPGTITNLAQINGISSTNEIYIDEATASIVGFVSTNSSLTLTACDSYTWYGISYNQSGTYLRQYINTFGFPSTDTLFLSINKSSRSSASISVCKNEFPFVWNGMVISEAGNKSKTIKNQVGCDSIITLTTTIKSITIGNSGDTKACLTDIYIPNTFTPNNDGKNDVFRAYGTFQKVTFRIYNQWGQLIYQTSNINGWDGISNGRPQPTGPYTYLADIVLNDGSLLREKGVVNLIR